MAFAASMAAPVRAVLRPVGVAELEPQPEPASVDRTVALIHDSFPDLVGIDRSLQVADDGHDVVVLHAVSRAPGDEVRRAYHGFLRRWDGAVSPEQRRYLRVVFAVRRS